jgi:hypothetical protein
MRPSPVTTTVVLGGPVSEIDERRRDELPSVAVPAGKLHDDNRTAQVVALLDQKLFRVIERPSGDRKTFRWVLFLMAVAGGNTDACGSFS